MTKLSFEEWKNSDEMSYDILDELAHKTPQDPPDTL